MACDLSNVRIFSKAKKLTFQLVSYYFVKQSYTCTEVNEILFKKLYIENHEYLYIVNTIFSFFLHFPMLFSHNFFLSLMNWIQKYFQEISKFIYRFQWWNFFEMLHHNYWIIDFFLFIEKLKNLIMKILKIYLINKRKIILFFY